MERDFMGLSSKESVVMVKEEIANDGCKDSGYTKGLGAQWPFSNKVSALPHLMSFKVGQDDKARKTMPESMSSGFGPLPTADAFEQNQRRAMLEFQKSFNHDRQGGTQFPLTAYPAQHDLYSVHRSHDVKMFSVPNQAVSVSMGNPYLKDHFAVAGQNLAPASAKQPLLGGIPVATQHYILPTTCSIAGITEPWNNVKAAGSPAQLTIFYGGSVNVYEDISPEKAQAIMFLAGSSSCLSSNASNLKAQIVTPSSKLGALDGLPINQPINTPNSAVSSPLSVSSHTGVPSGSGSTSNDEIMSAKAARVHSTSLSKVEPPKIMNAVGSVAATALMPSAVPQARKASLARFLEKRKERMMNAIPYNFCKNTSECTATESNGANFSASTAVDSIY
ncbi:protein TIFY 6B-like isoform X2 [Humulus lupulus]|uniref:protein TIFY 6B-like isoform X2 n=1 Tax=Humulus lupulus TaxID=3486 RepID=UPI002B414849|nr:protein TIFY 6B-like isoform X2 [Humulus lupulus]